VAHGHKVMTPTCKKSQLLRVGQDRRIRCLLEQLAAAGAMQRGTHGEANVIMSLTTPHTAGEKEQPDRADGEADAALRLELVSTKAALEDERQVLCGSIAQGSRALVGSLPLRGLHMASMRTWRLAIGQRLLQVHAEECQRLATEAAVARARASGAARSDLAAAAARAAEQSARETMARSQRDAAEFMTNGGSGAYPAKVICKCSIAFSKDSSCMQSQQSFNLRPAGLKRLRSGLHSWKCSPTKREQQHRMPWHSSACMQRQCTLHCSKCMRPESWRPGRSAALLTSRAATLTKALQGALMGSTISCKARCFDVPCELPYVD